jgi:hypothetical protein
VFDDSGIAALGRTTVTPSSREFHDMPQRFVLFAFAALLGASVPAAARTWTDSTGAYHVEADLIGFNDATVVLKKEDRRLEAVPVAKLSDQDRAYLRSKEAVDHARQSADATQTWTMASGLKVVGRVVDYAKKDVTIQQRRGRTYVNDRALDNLPEVYRKMLPKIVSFFERTDIKDERELQSWIMRLRGESRTFACEGVLLELDNGDEYGVPFFLFSKDDQNVLKPGWERWLASQQDRAGRDQESMLVRTQAQAYQQDAMANQQIAMMQLQMEGYEAGLFDLWEVRLYPGRGVVSPPLTVVVPGRDSRSATAEALRRNPGFVAGPVAKVRR